MSGGAQTRGASKKCPGVEPVENVHNTHSTSFARKKKKHGYFYFSSSTKWCWSCFNLTNSYHLVFGRACCWPRGWRWVQQLATREKFRHEKEMIEGRGKKRVDRIATSTSLGWLTQRSSGVAAGHRKTHVGCTLDATVGAAHRLFSPSLWLLRVKL